MTARGPPLHQVGAVVVVCLLVLSPLSPHVTEATSTNASGAESTYDVKTISSASHSVQPAAVAPGLANATGTRNVLVRLEQAPIRNDLDGDEAVAAMKAHANSSQSAVVDYAQSTEDVTLVNRFWLVNAVVLQVNTSTVALSEAASIRGVTEIEAVPKDEASARSSTERAASAGSERRSVEPTAGNRASMTALATNRSYQPGESPEFPYRTHRDQRYHVDGRTYTTDWGLAAIDAPAVWAEYDTMGEGAKVAVLDSGVDPSHPDIDLHTTNESDPTYPGGWAEFDRNGNRVAESEPHMEWGHGQPVSGLVAAGNESGRYLGVAPEAELMHGLATNEMSLIAGIEWAIEQDADVVSISRDATGSLLEWSDVVRRAESSGVVVVAGIGNWGEGNVDFPGGTYETLAVGAYGPHGDPAEWGGQSTGGKVLRFRDHEIGTRVPAYWPSEYVTPDVSAPGTALTAPLRGTGYREFSGTSAATPMVAGTVALMQSATDEHLSPSLIKSALRCTATKPDDAPTGMDTRFGAGMIDARAATDAVVRGQGVRGTIHDEDGEPVEMARIRLSDCSHATAYDGGYEMYASPGTKTMTVTAPGYEPKNVSVDVSNGEYANRSITLEKKPVIGTVTEFDDSISNGYDRGVVYLSLVDNVTIRTGPNNTVSPENMRVQQYLREPRDVVFGEMVSIDRPEVRYSFLVNLDDAASGYLELELTAHSQGTRETKVFGGRVETQNETTQPTPTTTETTTETTTATTTTPPETTEMPPSTTATTEAPPSTTATTEAPPSKTETTETPPSTTDTTATTDSPTTDDQEGDPGGAPAPPDSDPTETTTEQSTTKADLNETTSLGPQTPSESTSRIASPTTDGLEASETLRTTSSTTGAEGRTTTDATVKTTDLPSVPTVPGFDFVTAFVALASGVILLRRRA